MASITIKTPTRTLNRRAGLLKQSVWLEEIENNVAKICIGRLSESFEKAYEQEVSILATFLQRVIARTPVDESYERTVNTPNGPKTVKHLPDNEYCREHWYLEDTQLNRTLESKKFCKQGEGFTVVNDGAEIQMIKDFIKDTFPLEEYKQRGITPAFGIGNNCKHFDLLEYGFSGWKKDSEPVYGYPLGMKHGVQNQHSVQAPIGMLRITEAELQSLRRKPSTRSFASRYKGGRAMKDIPNDKRLKEFYNLIKRGKKLKYADIKRYLEMY